MGAELEIKTMKFSEDYNQVTFTTIVRIYNWDTIEELLEVGRNNWCLEGECGAEFELSGEELENLREVLEFEDDTSFNDDFYRCSLSYQVLNRELANRQYLKGQSKTVWVANFPLPLKRLTKDISYGIIQMWLQNRGKTR